MEIRELLDEYEFPGDDTPIIQGSALKALEDPNGEWGDKISILTRIPFLPLLLMQTVVRLLNKQM